LKELGNCLELLKKAKKEVIGYVLGGPEKRFLFLKGCIALTVMLK
jgi:hypothetical protein